MSSPEQYFSPNIETLVYLSPVSAMERRPEPTI